MNFLKHPSWLQKRSMLDADLFKTTSLVQPAWLQHFTSAPCSTQIPLLTKCLVHLTWLQNLTSFTFVQ